MSRSTSRYRDVVAHLLKCGLVSPADVHRHGVQASDTSRSHGVTIVEIGDKAGFVVKDFHGASADDLQGSLARERSVYRLAVDHVELQAFTTKSYPEGDDEYLVIDYLGDSTSIGQLLQRSSLYDPAVAQMAGHQLALWHKETHVLGAESIDPSAMWVYNLFADDRPEFLTSNPPVADWSASFVRKTAAARLLSDVATWWCPDAIVHGDLRFENCLVSGSGSSVGLRFVDWEQAGWGDPAWDVASFLQEYFTFGGVLTLAAEPDRRLQATIATFLDAYRSTASFGDDFLRRVVAFTGVKMLHRAVQIVSWQPGADTADADRHGLLGVELMERVDEGVAWLEAGPHSSSDGQTIRPIGDEVQADFDRAIEMVKISSVRSAAVDGVEVVGTDSGVAGGPASMANAISDALYGSWYLGVADGQPRSRTPEGPLTPDQLSLASSLTAAHAASTKFESGWTVDLASSSGRLRVSKDDRRIEIDAGDAVGETARPPSAGDPVAIRHRIAWVDNETGTWWTQSVNWKPESGQAVVRFYWNLSPYQSAAAVRVLTSALTGIDARWTIKIQINADQVWRPDSAVLYVASDDIAEVNSIIDALAVEMEPHLDRATPRLARRIAPGVGTADGVVNGRSFGQVRCSLVADGLVTAAMSGIDPIDAIIERFVRAGFDPSQPHLDPVNLELAGAAR